MNATTSGPVPTTQVFLYQIPELQLGSKIRFLGCVSKYDVSRGILTVEHNYSGSGSRVSDRSTPQRRVVNVDVNLLLESLTYAELQIGAWLNILGYVRLQVASETPVAAGTNRTSPTARRSTSDRSLIFIQAVIVIPTGAIRVGEYERVLQDAQEADRRVNRPK